MLEIDLYTLLSTDASIAAATSTGAAPGVWLGAIPKGKPDSNAIVIQTQITRTKGYDGTNALLSAKVQVDVYHPKYSACKKLANAVIALLQDLSGALTTTNVQGVIPDKDLDMNFEPGDSGFVFRRMLDFQFIFTNL